MTGNGHERGNGEHTHTFDWREELQALREDARHFYMDHFDWRGYGPPSNFQGPRYFPPAEEWRLLAELDRGAPGTGERVTLATSTGQLREMEVAGDLVFSVEGREGRLRAFLTHDDEGYDVLFVPFRDATSGAETYAAGRYVEMPFEKDDDAVELDFNLAYNPTCVYSPAYDCPYPPPQNRLEFAVRAGEMMPLIGPTH